MKCRIHPDDHSTVPGVFLGPGVFLVEQSGQPLHAFHLHFVAHGFAYLAHHFEHAVTTTGGNEWWHSGCETGDYNGVLAMFILPRAVENPCKCIVHHPAEYNCVTQPQVREMGRHVSMLLTAGRGHDLTSCS